MCDLVIYLIGINVLTFLIYGVPATLRKEPSPRHSSFPYTVHVSYGEVTQKKRKFVL